MLGCTPNRVLMSLQSAQLFILARITDAQPVNQRRVHALYTKTQLMGLVNIKRIKKPVRPARKGVPNPFRPGETLDVAAKPASTVVKIQPLAGLKHALK